MQVIAEIGRLDSKKKWREELRVHNMETAEQDIRRIIKDFNEHLRLGEKPRKFIRLIKERVVDCNTKADFFELASEFCGEVTHEGTNPYGNAWCKAHFDQVGELLSNLGKKGNLTRFKNLVSRSPYRQEFSALINSKLKIPIIGDRRK